MPPVRVRLFAAHREAAGRAVVEVELPSGATVGDLRRALAHAVPALLRAGAPAVVAVNGEFADDARRLNARDEIALFPPVAGG